MSEELDILNGNEIALIDVLAHVDRGQREIARRTGFSLGMTNMLLKRLTKKGYVKVINLNGRTLRYMLTPAGMQEKLKKSYNFVLSSVRQVYELRERVVSILAAWPADSVCVYLWGGNEIARLAEEVAREAQYDATAILNLSDVIPGEDEKEVVLLVCDMNAEFPEEEVSGWHVHRLYDI